MDLGNFDKWLQVCIENAKDYEDILVTVTHDYRLFYHSGHMYYISKSDDKWIVTADNDPVSFYCLTLSNCIRDIVSR